MNKTRAVRGALVALTTLLVAGCGLKDDLYIPDDEPEATSAATRNTDDDEESGPSSAPSP